MGWFEFILERYNYWIVIVLMMTGLYIVFARGNLVKKIVGLNLFQTSVFIFYITIGKIAGGTAPIYMDGELDHGASEGGEAGHGEALHDVPIDAPDDAQGANALGQSDSATDHAGGQLSDKIDNTASAGLHSKIENDFAANDLKAALQTPAPAGEGTQEGATEGALLHSEPATEVLDKISNDALSGLGKPDAPTYEVTPEGLHDGDHANVIGDAVGHVSDIIYTNPLPHVLILTAIVVGVATTAVGLALAVRIREAYGTIEEDELEAMDNVAEFGAAHEGAS